MLYEMRKTRIIHLPWYSWLVVVLIDAIDDRVFKSKDTGYIVNWLSGIWTRLTTGAKDASMTEELKKLRTFFQDVADLTVDHDVEGDSAVVYPSKLSIALKKVDPQWYDHE